MCMKVTGYIDITFKQEENYIYQIIRIIPNATKNLHYFIRDKYKLGRKVDDFLMKVYLGDGDNILFVEDNKYRNMNTIKYQIMNPNVNPDLHPKKYFISGEIPSHDSCINCIHMKKVYSDNKIQCMFYKEFLKPKICCIDFCEKG